VNLTWDAPSDSADPVASYKVYRAAGGSSSYTMIGSTSGDTATYTDDTVAEGTTYVYYVVGVDSSGNSSAPSNIWTAVVP
jgi:fibronectin type 3 domain-containing protein